MENHGKSEGRGLQQGTSAMCFSWQGEGSDEGMKELECSRLKWKGEMKHRRKVAETLTLW